MKPSFNIEKSLLEKGFRLIAGVDEAGRGPLAGPVVAAAVILRVDCSIPGLDDSKKLSSSQRNTLFKLIKKNAYAIGVGISGQKVIDKKNILSATFIAMRKAVEALKTYPDMVLVDGNMTIPEVNATQKAIIKGDSQVCSIAAASIIAKVTRDKLMLKLHKKYPEYGFDKHKGYGTKKHIQALQTYGITPFHRLSFYPVKIYALAKASKGVA